MTSGEDSSPTLRSLRVQASTFALGSVGGSGPVPGPHDARRDREGDRRDPRRCEGLRRAEGADQRAPDRGAERRSDLTSTLRAARTAGRFAVVVADWNREYVTGMKGPWINPPRERNTPP